MILITKLENHLRKTQKSLLPTSFQIPSLFFVFKKIYILGLGV
jgi:hypothetical protein